ncbi:hypothetical protein HSX11_01685 [Oxalobacteraceae bacterium]|nr:hypothetical protein [Oxalobacteraceae bacterium]
MSKKPPVAAGEVARGVSASPSDPVVEIIQTAPVTVRARVLVDCDYGRCNDVIEIDADLVEALGTVVDAAPEAVAYADSLKG